MGKAAAARMAQDGSWADYAGRLIKAYTAHLEKA
jgi:hypothetical protein